MRRVLVILQDLADTAVAESAVNCRSELECDRLLWDLSCWDRVTAGKAELIVAVPGGDQEAAGEFLRWFGERTFSMPILVVLPKQASPELFRESFEIADDVATQPLCEAEFHRRVDRLLPTGRGGPSGAETNVIRDLGMAHLVGRHPAFQEVLHRIPSLADSNASVLISGETGTGKELCARAIHNLSRRRNCAFIAVDCGAIPEQLFENEFFGHARGAFTDARLDQKGLAALADGGMLFLDEVDSLPPSCQSKLLRFLEEHTYRPLGSDRFCEVDVNIVAATNNDLESCVKANRFRADLFFRLDVLRLHLPPLRERKTDIDLLASHFLRGLAQQGAASQKSLSPVALRKLHLHDWPGNVRELFNVLQRAAFCCDGALIQPAHISIGAGTQRPAAATFQQARAEAIEAFERSYIEQVLRDNDGNITRAARQAAKDRRVFGRLAKKYKIQRRGPEPGLFRAAAG